MGNGCSSFPSAPATRSWSSHTLDRVCPSGRVESIEMGLAENADAAPLALGADRFRFTHTEAIPGRAGFLSWPDLISAGSATPATCATNRRGDGVTALFIERMEQLMGVPFPVSRIYVIVHCRTRGKILHTASSPK